MQNIERDRARQALTQQVLSARTLSEIADAWQALKDWIGAYPEEAGMADAFEQLSLMRDIAEAEEAERIRSVAPVATGRV